MKCKFMKKAFMFALAGMLTVQMSAVSAFAVISNETLLYKDKEVQNIAGGVTYEKSSRLYKDGWLDVYVITVDTTNENIELDVIDSMTEFGLKKSVETFAKENNVIAAVNGDFFGSGNPQSSMGQVFSDGKIEQAQNYYNGSPRFAGVFIDTNGTAFVDYLSTQYRIFNSSTSTMEIAAKNKYNGFDKPVYIDRSAMNDTAAVDKRISGLVKLVVENDIVTKISAPGELVTVPENGYIVIMKSAAASQNLKTFSVGQKILFSESASLLFRPNNDLSQIKMGISGGGEILRNGAICSNGLIVGKNARNPRTVLGVTRDKKKLIIMAVDGRRNGLGVTHNEVANLLLEYGAYDAIHLDGGGSTTMVVKQEGASNLSVVNVPSEGSQRAVSNALGIKTLNKSSGVVSKVDLSISENILMKNATSTITIKGYDEYLNPIDVNINDFTFKVTSGNGVIDGNKITPSENGDIEITAYMNETAMGSIKTSVSAEPVRLKVSADINSLEVGESSKLSVSYVDKDGHALYAGNSDIEWIVENPEVGYVENGAFIAKSDGLAKLTAAKGNYTGTATLSVGNVEKSIENFENNKNLEFLVYPNEMGITGGCGKTNADKQQGESSYVLNYSFAPNSTVTQAAYMSFEKEPIQLENARKINMWVKGDGNGCLLRGIIKDKNNTQHLVTFTESIDFNDWQNLTASVPADAAAPLKLEKIYVASLQTTNAIKGSIFVDNLTIAAPAHQTSSYSNNTSSDYLNAPINGAPSAGEEDITIFGQTAKRYGDNMNTVMNDVVRTMAQNARAMYFVGDTDVDTSAYNVVSVRWNNKYSTTNTSNLSIVNIATGSGACIRTADYNQWRWFRSYLYDFSKNNIVIGIDKDIWGRNGSNLTDSRERTLFHKILKDFVRDTGKNVIVVAATGYNTDVHVEDGIRYITLNGASAQNSHDLKNFKYLRLRVSENELKYDIKNIYN